MINSADWMPPPHGTLQSDQLPDQAPWQSFTPVALVPIPPAGLLPGTSLWLVVVLWSVVLFIVVGSVLFAAAVWAMREPFTVAGGRMPKTMEVLVVSTGGGLLAARAAVHNAPGAVAGWLNTAPGRSAMTLPLMVGRERVVVVRPAA